LKVSFGGVCLRPDSENKCEQRDIQTAKVKRFAVFEEFNKKNCIGGYDMAIIELEKPITVNI
jgi:hypothetical protein